MSFSTRIQNSMVSPQGPVIRALPLAPRSAEEFRHGNGINRYKIRHHCTPFPVLVTTQSPRERLFRFARLSHFICSIQKMSRSSSSRVSKLPCPFEMTTSAEKKSSRNCLLVAGRWVPGMSVPLSTISAMVAIPASSSFFQVVLLTTENITFVFG